MPLDANKILTSAMVRVVNDQTLKTILGGQIQAVKGPRRTKDMEGSNSFTLHVLSAPMDPDSKVYNGTLLINFYCQNYSSGNAKVETMGPVAARVAELFDDRPLVIDGYNILI